MEKNQILLMRIENKIKSAKEIISQSLRTIEQQETLIYELEDLLKCSEIEDDIEVFQEDGMDYIDDDFDICCEICENYGCDCDTKAFYNFR